MMGTVLLVDDDPRVLDGLERGLRKQRFRLLRASSAREALGVLSHSPVDAVVSDEVMPGMSGTRLLAEVRQRWPDTARIVLTGHREFETAMRAINLGEVHRFFVKPCDAAELHAALVELTAERALRREARRLLDTVRRQSAVLEAIERTSPGLTRIERDDSGSILLDDRPVDVHALLAEIEEELQRSDCPPA